MKKSFVNKVLAFLFLVLSIFPISSKLEKSFAKEEVFEKDVRNLNFLNFFFDKFYSFLNLFLNKNLENQFEVLQNEEYFLNEEKSVENNFNENKFEKNIEIQKNINFKVLSNKEKVFENFEEKSSKNVGFEKKEIDQSLGKKENSENFFFVSKPEKTAKVEKTFSYKPEVNLKNIALSYAFDCKNIDVYSDSRFNKTLMLGVYHTLEFTPKLSDVEKTFNCSVAVSSEEKTIIQNFSIFVEKELVDLSIFYPNNGQVFRKNELLQVWASSKFLGSEIYGLEENYVWKIEKDGELIFSVFGKITSFSLENSGKYKIYLEYIGDEKNEKFFAEPIFIEIV
ncbi:MAG: hypothetical protein Fur0024_4820 [Patescibacteria group bacterium]